MITTIAEFKARFYVGMQIRQVWNSRDGEVNRVFTVTELQTNCVFGSCPDFPQQRARFEFPKKFEIEFTDRGWCRLDPLNGRKLSQYEWLEVPV